MHIVLDSMQFISDYRLKKHFPAFFNFIRTTDSKLIVPDIVIEEVLSNFQSEVDKSIKELSKVKSKYLDKYAQSGNIDVSSINSQFTKETKGYLNFMISELRKNGLDELVAPDIQRRDLIEHVTQRKKPFNENGAGLGDYLIWQYVKHCVNQFGSTAFITKNSKDFCDPINKLTLHSDFLIELGEKKHRLHLFPDLESFLVSQLAKPDGFNEEYLEKLNGYDEVTINVTRVVDKQLSDIYDPMDFAKNSEIKKTISKPKLDSFYMYEKGESTYAVVMRFQVVTLAEIDIGSRNPDFVELYDSRPHATIETTCQVEIHSDLKSNALKFVKLLNVSYKMKGKSFSEGIKKKIETPTISDLFRSLTEKKNEE